MCQCHSALAARPLISAVGQPPRCPRSSSLGGRKPTSGMSNKLASSSYPPKARQPAGLRVNCGRGGAWLLVAASGGTIRRDWPAPNVLVRQLAIERVRENALCRAGNHTLERTEAMGRGILLWLLGVPIPIIIILALLWH